MADFTGPDSMHAIMSGHTPQEAAELLARLERGQQAAWRASHEARFAPEGEVRFAAASELSEISVDAMWATVENGMRRPGESVAEFAGRTNRQAEVEAEAGQ